MMDRVEALQFRTPDMEGQAVASVGGPTMSSALSVDVEGGRVSVTSAALLNASMTPSAALSAGGAPPLCRSALDESPERGYSMAGLGGG